MTLLTTTENPTLGRGDLYFAPKRTDGVMEFFPIGNTPAFGLTVTTQTLKHFNSGRGVKTQDREVPVQTDYAGSFTTDNITPKNFASLLQGSTSVLTQTSVTAKVETFAYTHQGNAYQLGTDLNPSGVRNVSAVVVKVATVAKTINTDYVVDLELGLVQIVPGGGIADLASVEVTYNIAASSRDQTVSAATSVEGALKFIAYNPEGTKTDFLIRSCRLIPNGEVQIKAEEWQQLPFNLAISAPADGHAILADGRPY